jgi:tetratricopeptide (TPR) repeat protein
MVAVALLGCILGPAPALSQSDRADGRYRACMALAAAEPERAIGDARAWAAAGGGDPARHCEAKALVGLGRYDDAAERFEALADARDANAGARATLLGHAGQAWLLAEQTERALAALDRALQLQPRDGGLHIDRAQVYAETGRLREAVADLSAAIEIDPGLIDAYVFRASALRRLERPDKAAADLEIALGLDPLHPEALLERGLLRERIGDRDGARDDWTRLVTLVPDSVAAFSARANLARLGDTPPPSAAIRNQGSRTPAPAAAPARNR